MPSERDLAIDVLVELLGGDQEALAASEFYDRLCAAVCRLTRLERSVLLLYDHAYQAVRTVGSYGLEGEVARRLEGTLNETPIAQRALEDDDVIVISDLAGEVPERFQEIIPTETVACVPVAAGGHWLGVIFADAGGAAFELSDEERLPLRTLGRAAALVASVERGTHERERAHQLDQRIALTREIHEQVIQRLFALSLALGAEGPLSEADRARAHDELGLVLGDLRGALERWLAPTERETKVTMRQLLGRLVEEDPRVSVRWESGLRIPRRLEPLAQSVLAESLRNIAKHATPTQVDVEVERQDGALSLRIANDGAQTETSGTGLGLRLAAVEALRHHGVVEFGPLEGGRWRVRLVCPIDEVDGAAA